MIMVQGESENNVASNVGIGEGSATLSEPETLADISQDEVRAAQDILERIIANIETVIRGLLKANLDKL